jgi:hypothetical protein
VTAFVPAAGVRVRRPLGPLEVRAGALAWEPVGDADRAARWYPGAPILPTFASVCPSVPSSVGPTVASRSGADVSHVHYRSRLTA